MKATITKLKVDTGYSMVDAGFIVTGKLIRIVEMFEGRAYEPVNDLKEIQVGDMILVEGSTPYDALKTSPVREVLLKNPNEMEFKTTTSTYKLEVINLQ